MNDIKFLLASIFLMLFLRWTQNSKMWERRVMRAWDQIRLFPKRWWNKRKQLKKGKDHVEK